MAIVKRYIAACDICGEIEDAKAVSGQYNETEYTVPDGWLKVSFSSVILCPKCRKKLEM